MSHSKLENLFKGFCKNKKGISTWEFALVLVLSLPICLGFLVMMGAHVYGSYAQYATFMAARTYLAPAPGESEDERRSRAVRVFEEYMARLPDGIRQYGRPELSANSDHGLEFEQKDRNFMVRYSYRTRILPAMFGAFGEPFQVESESFLGREPSQSECMDDMASGSFQKHWDNGC